MDLASRKPFCFALGVAWSLLQSVALAENGPAENGPVRPTPDAAQPGTALDQDAALPHAFSLPTVDGTTVSLAEAPQATLHVVCILGTECPLARLYGPRLERLAERYRDRGVRFIGVNSNLQDSLDEVRAYAVDCQISFPMAKDPDRRVAMQLGATRTPEVFVLDRSGAIRYQGRIDDQYQPGVARAQAATHDLQNAIDQLLAGEEVQIPRTDAVGCLIALPKEAPDASQQGASAEQVTYCREVSRILNDHCVECHRAGEIGPFALEEYDEVVGWADMALEVIDQGRMPPWHASSGGRSFVNERRMPPDAVASLRRWVAAGTPYGDANDLPAPREHVSGWRLPESPHAVFAMSDQPYDVPAEGTVEYQYFVIDPHFTQDKWVSAVQVAPSNRAVVHHSIAFVRPPDGSSFRDIGLLAAYVPGQLALDLPLGYAQRVPAGSRIVFQMHYTPTGKPEQDLTQIGMVFAEPERVTHEVYAIAGLEQEFEIPPQAAGHTIHGKFGWFPKNGRLLSISPHMHLRGKRFEFVAERDKGDETLLNVPQYDFNWQHIYQWQEPIALADVKRLRFVAVYDNSSANTANPDPQEYVTWGDQTWQEMAVAFATVAEPLEDSLKEATEVPTAERTAEGKPKDATLRQRRRRGVNPTGAQVDATDREAIDRDAAVKERADAFAVQYVARFDRDGDNLLARHELPDGVRMFAFRNFDHDGDRLLSREEIAEEARWRFEHSH